MNWDDIEFNEEELKRLKISKVKVQQYLAIKELIDSYGRELTIDELVAEAKSKGEEHPLYRYFNWDLQKASEAYWKQQARALIKSFHNSEAKIAEIYDRLTIKTVHVTKVSEVNPDAPVWVHTRKVTNSKAKDVYVYRDDQLNDRNGLRREDRVEEEFKDLYGWYKRNRDISELMDLFKSKKVDAMYRKYYRKKSD